MKKLIAISVVFALVAGTAFAVDLSGTATGTVTVLKGDSGKDSKVTSGAEMNRLRIDGSGANDDGTFGGYIRAEAMEGWKHGTDFPFGAFYGHAWWKPIDQLKFWIGGNGGDGFFGKEGNTGWMFYQTASDTGVTNPNGVWYADGSYYQNGLETRAAFYAGGIDGANAFYTTISPIDIMDINLEIPFFDGGEVGDVIGDLIAQVDLKFDFGNIAITYDGDPSDATNGKAYVYFNLGAVENLSLDVGLGLTIPGDEEGQPLAAGLGVKYDISDAFKIKFRTVASFGGEDNPFLLNADVLPYFVINDSVTAFLSVGLGMTAPEEGDSIVGFHVNPYVQVGSEWGPKFLAGIQLWTNGIKDADDKSTINWSVPIAISVGF